MRYADHMDGGGWILPMIVMLLLIALAVGAVVWLARNQAAVASPRHGEGGSARDLLDRRLVSGEIGEEEYRRLRTALADHTPPGPPPGQPAAGDSGSGAPDA